MTFQGATPSQVGTAPNVAAAKEMEAAGQPPVAVKLPETTATKTSAATGAGVGLLGANLLSPLVNTVLIMLSNLMPTILTRDLVTPELGFSIASLIVAYPAYRAAASLRGSRPWVAKGDTE